MVDIRMVIRFDWQPNTSVSNGLHVHIFVHI